VAADWKGENTAVRIRRADQGSTLYPQKLTLTSPISGGRSVGIVRSHMHNSTVSTVVVEMSTSRCIARKFEVTSRLTVGQSVCLGIEPTLWTFDHIFRPFQVFGSEMSGFPSYTPGHWVPFTGGITGPS
jgi:hypothetical protein